MKIKLDSSLNFLQPSNVDLVRLGVNKDGGYVIPRIALHNSSALLSLGLGDDWSFEEQWANTKPNDLIYVYDGAIDYNNWGPVHYELYRQFFGYRATHIAHNVSRMPGDWTFEQAYSPLANYQVFLKIDIEGCEYQIIEEINNIASSVTGIAIEFHGTSGRQMFCNAVQELQKNFDIVHIHGNNTSPLSYDQLPEVLEISLLNKNLCNTSAKRTDVYLPGLDFPNNPGDKEYVLYF